MTNFELGLLVGFWFIGYMVYRVELVLEKILRMKEGL